MNDLPDNHPTIQIVTPPEVDHTNATPEAVKKSDLIMLNNAMRVTNACWDSVTSLGSLEKMTNITCKLIETRRHVLGYEYGAKSSNSGRGYLEPLP